jgi:zinc protease
MAWNTPEWGNKENAALDLAASVLSSGKSSRLFKKLVYEKQICTSAQAFNGPSELGGTFGIIVNVKKGKTVEEVEAAVNEILEELLKNGPTEEELKRVKASYFAGFIKGLERIGGFGGKSDLLAENEVYGGSPEHYKITNRWFNETTAKEVQMADSKMAFRWEIYPCMQPIPGIFGDRYRSGPLQSTGSEQQCGRKIPFPGTRHLEKRHESRTRSPHRKPYRIGQHHV